MRKFTTLFLLALAMTIGANQTFAQSADASNNPGKQDRPDPRDNGPKDDGPNDDGDDKDGDDPLRPPNRLILDRRPCLTAVANFECQAPEKKRVVVKKEPADCGCKHKTLRVGARFVTVVDCYYQAISVNGRPQTLYCTKDN